MNKLFYAIAYIGMFLVVGCNSKGAKNKPGTNEKYESSFDYSGNPEDYIKVDLAQDLSKLSLQELRLLRASLHARQGYCLMEADLRGYFTSKYKFYEPLMNARWEYEEYKEYASENDNHNTDTIPKFQLSENELAFIDKIDALIAQKQKANYVEVDGRTVANIDNVINMFQLESYPDGFLEHLKRDNYVITEGDNIQFFQVYEENDYRQMPNFVTTDMYLQLYHMYFDYTLRYLESRSLYAKLVKLCDGLYSESAKVSAQTTDAAVKKQAEFSMVNFAIAIEILTGSRKTIPAQYLKIYKEELVNINEASDVPSPFLETDPIVFPYSLFKPRGHYAKTDSLQKYFKAMMWLQSAYLCGKDAEALKKAAFMALLFKNDNSGELSKSYQAIYEPIEFLIGESDNVSIMDVLTIIDNIGVVKPEQLGQTQIIDKIGAAFTDVAATKNRIKPKVELTCRDKINFMPQRYLPDNEVLGKMYDETVNAAKAYPSGIDVFSAFGGETATEIAQTEEKFAAQWNKYVNEMNLAKREFSSYGGYNKSVYNKWLECLVTLQKTDKRHPAFMQTKEWGRKNLNTALASWAELKHDAILYGEQPMGAECGDGGPPDPICVGYVEPNVRFWEKLGELNRLTASVLSKHNLLDDVLKDKNTQLSNEFEFLLSVSNKEIKKEKLSEEEYKTIEIIGSNVEYMSLSLVDPDYRPEFWSDVKSNDSSVAVIADIFTRNIHLCDKNGILHVATGLVNDIYVLVEIEGYIYLTKGAVFSYYEFVDKERLNDHEWQTRINQRKTPPPPKWMEKIILRSKTKPKLDEKVLYSSGC